MSGPLTIFDLCGHFVSPSLTLSERSQTFDLRSPRPVWGAKAITGINDEALLRPMCPMGSSDRHCVSYHGSLLDFFLRCFTWIQENSLTIVKINRRAMSLMHWTLRLWQCPTVSRLCPTVSDCVRLCPTVSDCVRLCPQSNFSPRLWIM